MATALVTQIAYAVQTLFDPAGTAGRLVDLGKLANYGLLTNFTPGYLFTSGVNGAWYDPSDLTTLFQDAAGTTPVTAVEQPVGLMLDKSKGLVLGPELVTNGDFSNGTTGWGTLDSNGSISNGALHLVNASYGMTINNSIVFSNVPTPKFYRISVEIKNRVSGGIFISRSKGTGGGINLNSALLQANGVYTFYVTVPANTDTPTLRIDSWDTVTLDVDNISVRELPGNHAFNSSGNSANFPVLSARYNLLTKTEDFSDAVWGKNGATVSANAIIAPDGTLTADKLVENSATSEHFLTSASYTVPATSATVLIYAKAAGRTSFLVDFRSVDAGQGRAVFDLSAVTATVQLGSGASATITAVGDGWFRCVFAATLAANTSSAKIALVSGGTSNYTGDGTSGIYTWGADLRVANDALNQPAYQRVNTATDYDTVGFKPYLKFNGTNQWLQTNSIDFSYGDKMFVCAGVRKLSDAAAGVVVELSANATSGNPGAFALTAPPNTLGTFAFRSGGTISGLAYIAGYAAPITEVLSGLGDISGDQAILRINSAQVATDTADQGTGNYGNYPLYIGARAGTSLWFNGRLHQLVVAGKQASASEIGQTEAFINQKTGAY